MGFQRELDLNVLCGASVMLNSIRGTAKIPYFQASCEPLGSKQVTLALCITGAGHGC